LKGASINDSNICKDDNLHSFYEVRIKAGVSDPTKMTCTALQNAASTAGLPLATEALVIELATPKAVATVSSKADMNGYQSILTPAPNSVFAVKH
jgi:chaperonin GroEL (HSP60 family)